MGNSPAPNREPAQRLALTEIRFIGLTAKNLKTFIPRNAYTVTSWRAFSASGVLR